jgi:hypothetical protein
MALDDDTLGLMRGIVTSALRGESDSRYARLVRNVYEGALRRAYPICHRVMTDKLANVRASGLWDTLVDAFVASGVAHDPELWRMPQRLIDSTAARECARQHEIPWLMDLLRFEWSEIAVHMMTGSPRPEVRGDLKATLFAIEPDNTLLHLRYPVFRTSRPETWNEPGDYFLCCFRRRDSASVRYIELAPWAVLLMEEWRGEWRSEEELAEIAASILGAGPFAREAIRQLISLLTSEGLLLTQAPS